MQFIEKESAIFIQSGQSIPIAEKVDVLVCGGGPAGIAAAITAARNGASTLLVERAGFLGGTATGSMMGLITIPFKELAGFPKEFFGLLASEHGAGTSRVVPWDIEKYKFVAEDLALKAGVKLLFHTIVSESLIDGNSLKGVIVENKSGRSAILAKTVVDTTGDADVAARAGVPFVKGREKDGAMRPVTVMGLISNVDLKKVKAWIDSNPEDFGKDPGRRVFDLNEKEGLIRIDGFFSIIEKAKKIGLLEQSSPMNYLRFSAIVHPKHYEHADLVINCTRVYDVDGTNGFDVTRGEIEGRRQLRDAVKICQNLLLGFEESYLIQSSSYLGIRETRRIKGNYTLVYDDVANKRHFSDSIAVITSTNYGTAEVHSPDRGHEGSAGDVWAREMVLELTKFEFPVRCMLPEGYSNLIVAGRCASVTHEVDTYTRNMGPIGVVGQAAGTLAAVMSKKENPDWNNIPIKEVQDLLIGQGSPVNV